MPGLIEGASEGAGLGHAFLRHVERTRGLVHVVDGAERDPEWDYDVIRTELEAHDPALLDKPMLVAFNKLDLAAAAVAWPTFRAARERDLLPVVAIAAAAVIWGVRREYASPATAAANQVMVLPYDNRTGDPSLDPVGGMVAEWVTEGLARTGVVQVVPNVMVLQSLTEARNAAGAFTLDRVARLTGSGLAVTGSD